MVNLPLLPPLRKNECQVYATVAFRSSRKAQTWAGELGSRKGCGKTCHRALAKDDNILEADIRPIPGQKIEKEV
jgi:hypothetical protein